MTGSAEKKAAVKHVEDGAPGTNSSSAAVAAEAVNQAASCKHRGAFATAWCLESTGLVMTRVLLFTQQQYAFLHD